MRSQAGAWERENHHRLSVRNPYMAASRHWRQRNRSMLSLFLDSPYGPNNESNRGE